MKIPEITPEIAQRFWSKVNKDGPIPPRRPELGNCWVWTAANARGYGKFQMGGRKNPHIYIASRVSYFIATGIQPDPLHTLHHCDNPSCVNPEHLFLGTDADNVADAVSKGRNYPGYRIKPRPIERTARGENASKSKLTKQQVLEIVDLINKGLVHKEIAARYGISTPQISYIKNGFHWSHVTGIKKRHRITPMQ